MVTGEAIHFIYEKRLFFKGVRMCQFKCVSLIFQSGRETMKDANLQTIMNEQLCLEYARYASMISKSKSYESRSAKGCPFEATTILQGKIN